jgi:hypothetical protein
VNSLLRKARRLAAAAQPVIAARERQVREQEKLMPALARDHLLRVAAVYRHGEPKIDEPLALAYERALSKLGGDEQAVFIRVSERLRDWQPDGGINAAFARLIEEMPFWLYHLCTVALSAHILELPIKAAPSPFEFEITNSDLDAFPQLPQGMLVPKGQLKEDEVPGKLDLTADDRVEFPKEWEGLQKLTMDELSAFAVLQTKSKSEWTRQEYRLMRHILKRMHDE